MEEDLLNLGTTIASGAYYDAERWLEDVNNSTTNATEDTTTTEGETTTSDSDSDSSSEQTVSNTELLLSSLYLNGTVLLVGLPIYCLLRIHYKRLFAVRQWVEEIRCPLAVSQFGYVSWFWKVYSFTDEELVDQIGLDAVCSLRVLRMGFRLAVVGCLNSIWLFPAYATAPKTETETDLLNHFAINILQQGSARFLATVLGNYVFFGYFAWQLVRREFPWFIHQRHQWLKQFNARNYTVFLRNIPKNMRSSQALIQHFELLFGQGSVLQANIVLHINELSSAVAKRKGIVSNLEHALAYKVIYNKRPTHMVAPTTKVEGEDKEGMSTYRRCWGFRCKKIHKPPTLQLTVDSIDYYTTQLEKANEDVEKRMNDINKRTHRLSMMGREDSLHLRKYGSSGDDGDTEDKDKCGPFGGIGGSSMHNNNNGAGGKRGDLMLMDKSDRSSTVFTAPNMGSSRYLGNYFDIDDNIQRRLSIDRSDSSSDNNNTGRRQRLLLSSSSRSNNNDQGNKHVSFGGLDYSDDLNDDETSFADCCDDDDGGTGGELNDDGRLFEDEVGLGGGGGSFGDDDTGRIRRRGKSIARKVSKGVITPSSKIVSKVVNPSTKMVSKVVINPSTKIVSKVVINPSSKIVSKVQSQLPSQVIEQSSKIKQKVTNQAKNQLSKAQSQATSYMRVGATEALEMLDKAETMATTFLRIGDEEGKPDDAAFITFKSLVATHAAMQMSQHHEPFVLATQVAPDIPKFIFWGNVGADRDAIQTGQLISIGGTVAICLFWTIPVTFIVNLTNAQELAKLVNKPNFETYLENNPWFVKLLSNLSPILLLLLNTGLLPIVLKTVSRLEFCPSDAQLEASAFWKMCAFHIIQTFFVSMISGSIIDTLEEMIDNPQNAIYFLARSLPERSAYFMELLLVSTSMGVLLELFRAVPLFQAFVRSLLGWNLTQKERDENIGMFKPLCVVDKFYFSRAQSRFSLYFLVMFTYNAISPLINWFCLVFFVVLGSVYRHQFIFNYPKDPDTGGEIWLHFIRVLLSIMIIAEVVLAGFLSLKEAFTPLALLIPLIILSGLFIIYLQEVHFKIGHYLPARAALRKDLENDEAGVDYSLFEDHYKNPALLVRYLDADWDSGQDEIAKRATKRHSLNLSFHKEIEDPSARFDVVEVEKSRVDEESTGESRQEQSQQEVDIEDGGSHGKTDNIEVHYNKKEGGGDEMDASHKSNTTVQAQTIYGGRY